MINTEIKVGDRVKVSKVCNMLTAQLCNHGNTRQKESGCNTLASPYCQIYNLKHTNTH